MHPEEFRTIVLRNPVTDALLDDLRERDLPDAWIVSGCLCQTAWNALTGRALDYGINDYDVFYFDPDTSFEAEDRVIQTLRATSDRLGAKVEARNQARVHLWYPQKHGRPYPALQRSTDGIDRFLTCCTMVGIARDRRGDRIYAPVGFDDISDFIVRPNPAIGFSSQAYRTKAARWAARWPELTVLSPDAEARTATKAIAP
jgi:hypothetical protein